MSPTRRYANLLRLPPSIARPSMLHWFTSSGSEEQSERSADSRETWQQFRPRGQAMPPPKSSGNKIGWSRSRSTAIIQTETAVV